MGVARCFITRAKFTTSFLLSAAPAVRCMPNRTNVGCREGRGQMGGDEGVGRWLSYAGNGGDKEAE